MMAAIDTANAGWQASLALGFACQNGRSVLARRRHHGPLQVQRPFYPEGDAVCHVYVLHPPGGVVGGDELAISIVVDADAAALITTPGAGKFYRSSGALAQQRQDFTLLPGAVLEWLPQETIIFSGARVLNTTRVQLAAGAIYIGWEVFCYGRPGADERFDHGEVTQRLELWRDGMPLLLERGYYDPHTCKAAWSLASQPVVGNFVVTVADTSLRDEIRQALGACAWVGLVAVTQLDEVLVCRYLGPDAQEARACFMLAWRLVRQKILDRQVCAPRIWST
jgi:urease accessory protein